MSTLRVPSSHIITTPVGHSLGFSPANLRAFARYLETSEGVDIHEFTTDDGLPDLEAARRFCDGMCRQLGRYLDEAVSVERCKNRVMVILRNDWATKA